MRSPACSATLISFVILVTACAPAGEQPAPTAQEARSDQEQAEIEEMLFQMENDWMEAHFSRDPSAPERILADDLVYTLATGEVVGKQRYIELYLNNPLIYDSMDLTSIEAHWYGDDVVLVVGGTDVTSHDAEGNVFQYSGVFTNVFVERDGRWQCAIGHLTVIDS